MSMSVRDDGSGLEYAGALGPRGLFPSWRNLARPAYLRMLVEIPRFHRRARALLETARGRGRQQRRRDAARLPGPRPLLGATSSGTSWSRWSPACGRATRPWRWTTRPATCSRSSSTTGCSASSGRRSGAPSPAARASTSRRVGRRAARRPPRHQGHLGARDPRRRRDHRRQRRGRRRSTRSSSRPTRTRRWRCSPSRPGCSATCSRRCPTRRTPPSCTPTPRVLPTEPNALGRRGTTCAGRRDDHRHGHGHLRHDPPAAAPVHRRPRYLVTLGGKDLVDPAKVIETMEYAHPIYTPASVAAQRRLPEIATPTGWPSPAPTTAGASTRTAPAPASRPPSGWASSGPRPTAPRVVRRSPSSTRPPIRHQRRQPFRHGFTYGSHSWLVDLDHLPAPRRTRRVRGPRPPRLRPT